jgi:hypothetical protein
VNQILLVLITALVTGVVSITGIWFGSRLTRKSEDRKWRRDHALEAYTELIAAIDIVIFECDRIYVGVKCGTTEHNEQAELVLEKLAEMDRIAKRVFLLAPSAVNNRMHSLTQHVGEKIAKALCACPKIKEGERDAAKDKLAVLLAAFTNDARNDLGIHAPLQRIAEPE